MAIMPRPIAKLGVEVLRSYGLRDSASQMSYFDKETFATKDAVLISQIHCKREGWDDAFINFMQSGGFSPSNSVPLISQPTLVLWGRQDGILDGKEFANKVSTHVAIFVEDETKTFYILKFFFPTVCRNSTQWPFAVD